MVPALVEDLCDYVTDNWVDKSALHLASFVMWRMNWIHPFDDGNGRTSRALSYLVMSMRIGYRLPGRKTIPERIAESKEPYYEALEAADAEFKEGRINIQEMEKLIGSLLAAQLIDVGRDAGFVFP
jgi:Fic family protein